MALKASGVAVFVFACAAMGLGAAAVARVVAGILGAAGVEFGAALVIGFVAAFPLAIWLLTRLMRFVRPRLGRFERWIARDSTVTREALPEAFTLLLRGFADDELGSPRSPSGPASFFLTNRLEPRIVEALAPIGPVLAVGRPGEELPQSGAARLYVTDAEWRATVEELTDRARAVVLLVGEGSGVWWEIDAVLRRAPLAKLAFMFPRAEASGRLASGFHRRHQAPMDRVAGPLFERFDTALRRARALAAPRPRPGDQLLVFGAGGRPEFLPTRMAGTYYALAINPVYLLFSVLVRAFPSMPWRLSIEGEISYARTFAPFVRRFR